MSSRVKIQFARWRTEADIILSRREVLSFPSKIYNQNSKIDMTQNYRITLLPGDGIGPEIIAVAVDVLKLVAKQLDIGFEFQEALMGGAAIDATGTPLPEETLEKCRNSDAVLLAAIGGSKWGHFPRAHRPGTRSFGL